MSKSAMYAANTSGQSVAAGGNISFGNIIRRFGCNVNLSGSDVTLRGAGYYDIDAEFVVTASAAGTAAITLYKDGTAIPGAVASFTAATDSVYCISIPALVRTFCCTQSTITAVLTGVAGTISNAAIRVSKI